MVDWVPGFVYVKTEAIQRAHAEGMLGAFKQAMSRIKGYKLKLVAKGSDCACVNLMQRPSVTALLKRDVPELIVSHCVNHRLEFGVLDDLKQ